jgi:gas vesicle protein
MPGVRLIPLGIAGLVTALAIYFLLANLGHKAKHAAEHLKHSTYQTGEHLQNVMHGHYETAKNKMGSMSDTVSNQYEAAKDKMSDQYEATKDKVSELSSKATGAGEQAKHYIQEKAEPAGPSFSDKLRHAKDSILGTHEVSCPRGCVPLQEAGTPSLVERAAALPGEIASAISGKASEAQGKASGMLHEGKGKVSEKVHEAKGHASEKTHEAKGKSSDMASKLPDLNPLHHL